MFHDSLQNERDLGINCWERECPLTEGLAFTIPGPDKTRALFWEAKLDHPGQSVDQRVKFAGWMNEFAKRGGELAIKNAGPADIDEYSKTHDLVIVAAGKSEVNRMFARDAKKSPYDQPKRVLALTYVKKMEPRTPFTAVSFNLIPGVGEYFSTGLRAVVVRLRESGGGDEEPGGCRRSSVAPVESATAVVAGTKSSSSTRRPERGQTHLNEGPTSLVCLGNPPR